MTYLSKDFNREEFTCKCGCGLDTVDAETLFVLQLLRDHFNAKVTILSGCRCEEHNAFVGGSDGSWHIKCRASDFWIEGVEPKLVVKWLESNYPDKYGIGLYSNFTHLDTRHFKARWNKVT